MPASRRDTGQQIHGETLGFLLVHVAHLDGREGNVFKDRLVGEQVERLEHHADFGAQLRELSALLGQRLAVDADVARLDGLQAVDGAAHRRLAGAGRPHDDEHFALVDGQVDVFQYVEVAEVLFHVSQFDERSSCGFIARYQRHHGEYCFLFF